MHIQHGISLLPYNTFGIDVQAKAFAPFYNTGELQELLQQADNALILGGGSNVLFTKDYDGWILHNQLKGIELVHEDADHYYVKAAAGEVWHTLVLHCIEKGYAGLENLSLIPGSVGASPMQNIGAYGVEIKDVFHSLQAYHVHDKTIVSFGLADCAFGYRESVFKRQYKNQFVILSVTYKLNKQPVYHTAYGAIEQQLEAMGVQQLSIKAISQAVIYIRQSKLPDPAVTGNAGSFFKNPKIEASQYKDLQQQYPGIPGYNEEGGMVKVPAGWLIEQCQWKGYRKGDAGCHAKQALVLVNYGKATGNEIYTLSQEILNSVQQRFGITLEREVNII
jgi:UDP-N-acetylmuramate dehydrogenase